MATTVWTGAAGQTASADANWTDGAPGAATDAVYPDDSAIVNPPGALTLTSLVSPVRSIQVAPGATYPVTVTAPLGLLIVEGRGLVTFTPKPTTEPVEGGVGRVIVRSRNIVEALHIALDGSETGLDLEELIIESGKVRVTRSGGTDHAVRRAFVLPHEARTILEIADGVEDVVNAGELILNAGAAPTAVSMSAGQWTNYGAPSRAVISGGFVDWRRTTENESTVFLARGELATSQGAYIGRLTVGPHGRYIEGPGTSYGTGGASYIEDQEPILIEL
jgi:hypothetical protein